MQTINFQATEIATKQTALAEMAMKCKVNMSRGDGGCEKV